MNFNSSNLFNNLVISNLNVTTDLAHSEFIRSESLTYPDINLWFSLIDESYGFSPLAQSMIHAANLYVNVAPALQAACESRLFEAIALGRHTLSYLCSFPDLHFDSLFIKADHLARVDLNNLHTVLREETISPLLQSGESAIIYKEVFFYTDTMNNELRVGFSVISSTPTDSYKILYFDSATTHNFSYKLYDFINNRFYTTNMLVSRGPVENLLNNLSLN